MINIPNCA